MSYGPANTTESFKKTRTSSPTLIELPPHPGNSTRSPALTLVGTTLPSLFGAPGPTAITVASGNGELVEDEGRKIPDAVFCETFRSQAQYERQNEHVSTNACKERRTVSGLKRWTKTRSRRGMTALMLLNVAWAACHETDRLTVSQMLRYTDSHCLPCF